MKPLKPQRLLEGGGQGVEADRSRALLERLEAEEPLAEGVESAMQARVWRRLEAGERPSRAPFRPLALGVAAGAAILLVLFLIKGPGARGARDEAGPQLLLATGHLFAEPAGSAELPAGSSLASGARLHTDAARSGLVHIAEVAELLVQPGSTLSIAPGAGDTVIELAEGEVVAQVSPRPPGHAFIVEAPGVRVRVVGTLFLVRASAAGAFVSVSRGAVLIERGGESVRVEAGRSWSSAAPDALAPDAISPADRALLEGGSPASIEPVRAPASAPAPATSAASPAAPSAAPPPPRAPAEHARSTPPASAAAPPHGASRAAPAIAPASPFADPAPAPAPALVVAVPNIGTPTVGAPTNEPPAALPPVPESRPAAPARVAVAAGSDPYRAAGQLLARGQSAAAAAAFAAIVSSGGAHRDLALYELGRIRQRDLGDKDGALEAFRRYRADYPGGALTQEVELSLIDLELGRAQPADRAAALEGITAFLHDHRGSGRAAEMHLLRGNLLRERGDCEGALADYREAGGAYASDALYFTAFCQQKLGRLDEARASLRDYLGRFPSGAHRAEASAALAASGR